MKFNYYEDYCIDTFESLQSKLDSKGYLKNDIKLMGNFKSLGSVKKIYGTLNIDNDNLYDLGELNYIKSDLWIHNENSQLKSLFKIEKIGGSLLINGSNITDLGELKRVGGKVNLRDTNITDLGKLEYVGGDLFLSKSLKGLSLEGIEVKGKIRYWSDKKDSKVQILSEKHKTENELFFSDIHNQELRLKKRVLDGKFLLNRCYSISDYNYFTIENFTEFISFVDSKIEELYGKKYSFYHTLYGELKFTKDINNEFPKVKLDKRVNYTIYVKKLKKESNKLISENINSYPFNLYLKILEKFKRDEDWNKGFSRYWLSYNESKLEFANSTGNKDGSFIYYVENIIRETFSVFIDTLQNKFRVSKGIPKIGEGWVSETDLYYKLKEKFRNTEVIHHGRTKWLGQQHIDIWFPQYKIGVEYQGEQHSKPIDFFGGEESFKKSLERDERKKRLFKENNSILIEVHPNYNLEDVIRKIESYI